VTLQIRDPNLATHYIDDRLYLCIPGYAVYWWTAWDEDPPAWRLTARNSDVFLSENKEYELNEH